jgi:hypothetical protein
MTMKTEISLCIKDLYHRWPYVALLWLILAARAALDVLLPRHAGLTYLHDSFVWRLAGILMYLFSAMVIQSDPLAGDRQFWVTRPISSGRLLAGKLLFLVCFIQAPILMAQSAALFGNGYSLFRQLPILVDEQCGIAFGILAVALFAAMTPNLGQLLGKLLTFCLVLYLVLFGFVTVFNWIFHWPIWDNFDWGSAESLRAWILDIPLGIAAIVLLCLQYARRLTPRITTILAFSIMMGYVFCNSQTPICTVQTFWHIAAKHRAQADDVWARQSPVTLALSSDGPSLLTHASVPDGMTEIALPIEVAGIPQGRMLLTEWQDVTVTAPDGAIWESGWTKFGKLTFNLASGWASQIAPENGKYLLETFVDQKFYQRIRKQAVWIRVSLAFRLLGPPRPVLPEQNRFASILNNDGIGLHATSATNRQPVCYFSRLPSAILIYRKCPVPLIRGSNSTSIWRYKTNVPPGFSFELSEERILSYPEEAWFETTLDIPQIHLDRYYY